LGLVLGSVFRVSVLVTLNLRDSMGMSAKTCVYCISMCFVYLVVLPIIIAEYFVYIKATVSDIAADMYDLYNCQTIK